MSETITQYEQYPRSQFPGQVDNWDNMQDINSLTAPLALAYNNLIQEKKYTEAAKYLSVHPELDTILFNAQKFNQLMDGVKATQQFFKDDVKTYINGLSNATVGIDDNLNMGDVGADTNSYSITKIHNLLNPEVITIATDINNLKGNSNGCNKLYCWDEKIVQSLTNLPTGCSEAGMLYVARKGNIILQIVYCNGKNSYRITSNGSFSNIAWCGQHRLLTVTLKTSNWSGDSAPYSQTVSVQNLRSTDNPLAVSLLKDGATVTEQKAYNKAFSFLAAGTNVISDGKITFKVYKKPVIDFTIGLKGV